MVRFKNRYLLTEVRGDGACPNKAQLLEAIRESVRVSFGDVGHAVVALALQSASPLPASRSSLAPL